jgi:hypothetical protein
MVPHTSARWATLATALVLAVPAAAQASDGGPAAHAAGGDAPPLNPPIVGIPIQRTDDALAKAADAIDAGNGAGAVGPLTATRRYLLRSYNGAKYLIAHPPPAPAEEATAAVAMRTFVQRARGAVRASKLRAQGKGGWVHARAADDPVGPVIADGPTAVFNVLTSQFNAATAAAGMAPDTKGDLLSKVKMALNTSIILRNRLVQVVHNAAPPAEEAGAGAHAAQEESAATFDTVMPGLVVLLDAEIQQLTALSEDSGTPADVKPILTSAASADRQIEALVNQFWPPAAAED